MKVHIQRIDKSLSLPCYETNGAVGFDLLARMDVTIESNKAALIPGNIVVKVPEGYMLLIASRSSLPRKKGLSTPHGLGIIDHDFCGPEDEIQVQVFNFTEENVVVKRGEKIAQGVFVRVDKFEWEEVEKMQFESRGGFGSTGGYYQEHQSLEKKSGNYDMERQSEKSSRSIGMERQAEKPVEANYFILENKDE